MAERNGTQTPKNPGTAQPSERIVIDMTPPDQKAPQDEVIEKEDTPNPKTPEAKKHEDKNPTDEKPTDAKVVLTPEQQKLVEEEVAKAKVLVQRSMKGTIDNLRSKLREKNTKLHEAKQNPTKVEFESEEERDAYERMKKMGVATTDELQIKQLEDQAKSAQDEYNKALTQEITELEKEYDGTN